MNEGSDRRELLIMLLLALLTVAAAWFAFVNR
jgi:hypothetical protein